MKKQFCLFLALSSLLLIFVGCASTQFQTDSYSAESIVRSLTTEEKVAQLFVIRPDQLDFAASPKTKLTSRMKKALKRYPVGGFCLFAQNIKSKKQLKKFNADLKKTCSIEPILAVDEEGGRVARLARTNSLGIENIGAMEAIGRTDDVQTAWNAGSYIGSYLREYGFTMDFAPVADVNTNPQNIVIGDRAFGNEPERVSDMVGAFLGGLHAQSVAGCIKHFPGHGDTQNDTHADYVAVTKSWEELEACELIPFRNNLSAADSVMVAHVTLSVALDDGFPASLSHELITGKLRDELGYDGVILTDALEMGAINKNYGSAEAAVLAFEAGNDILLMPADFFAAYEGMLDAVRSGRISTERLDESVTRILHLKGYY